VLLANEVLPDRTGCCGVWGEAGRAVCVCRRLEVADVRLLALVGVVSLDMVPDQARALRSPFPDQQRRRVVMRRI
jgi:hypothetical protein